MWTVERIKKEMIEFMDYASEVLELENETPDITKIDVKISGRMTKTKGMFTFSTKTVLGEEILTPIEFKFAKHLLENYSDEDILETIKHEVVHFIVNTRYNKNMGHSEVFKTYCRVLGTSDETYFTASIKEGGKEIITRKKQHRYECVCQECGRVYNRKVMRKDGIEDMLWWSWCACGSDKKSELHVIDTKEKVVYVRSKKTFVATKIALDDYKAENSKGQSSQNILDNLIQEGFELIEEIDGCLDLNEYPDDKKEGITPSERMFIYMEDLYTFWVEDNEKEHYYKIIDWLKRISRFGDKYTCNVIIQDYVY